MSTDTKSVKPVTRNRWQEVLPHRTSKHHETELRSSGTVNTSIRGRSTKYSHHPPISNVVGFVVNIHNPVNFDIDLFLTPQQQKQYEEVIKTAYIYMDSSTSKISEAKTSNTRLVPQSKPGQPGLNIDKTKVSGTRAESKSDMNPIEKRGMAYRCRLRDVGVHAMQYKRQHRSRRHSHGDASILIDPSVKESYTSSKRVMARIGQQIDKQNGWVLVTLTDVDVYYRLLVDITDPISHFDLKSIHLDPSYKNVYYRYGLEPK